MSRTLTAARRRALPVALAGVAALGVAACGSSKKSSSGSSGSSGSASTSGSSSSGKHYTIALVPGLTTDPFYITMHAGAAAEAKKLGVTLTWQGGTTFSPNTQLPVVDALLAKHPSALLIAPTDVNALKAPIQKFTTAGIPVLAVDTTINDTSLLTAQITSNNFQGGEAAADAIAKLAHKKGQVAVENVQPGVSTTDARQAGFLAEMKKYPNMQVIAKEYDQDSPTTAESQVRNLILAHPGLVGVFGTNLYSAQGAGKAVVAAGKKGKVFVAGYDGEPAEIQLLKQGVINILVMQQPAVEGADAVKYAYDKLTGKTSQIPKKTLVKNVVATTANASSPSVSKYFYKTSFTG
ncbi:MAG TPA: ABC transporter substrate-binding protein [Solirubrobacteraceae bacterium]|nr:ABC transporter substrate-binding protein [Solirubrobacteraceae bacterium]